MTIRLHGGGEGRRRPADLAGAGVFTFVGAAAPAETEQWKFEGLTGKTKFELNFPESTSATTVWITASWYNVRGQLGPACAPRSVNLPASAVVPAIAA